MSEGSSSSKKPSSRQLRERKQRKLYSDEWALGDDEVEGGRGFSLADKLESPRFEHPGTVIEMQGSELTVEYLQKNGFTTPLLFREKTGLGLRVPTSKFTINDVRMCVGSRRLLDVMDVNTQKNTEMTMKDWQRYYEDPNKERLLNVISLEFSHTRLENYVTAPRVVRMIDWVEVVWPRHLKDQQTEATNVLDEMMYPKVQKYCLMSVKGCYTDFHVDFGGTSVWYHILKGAKVFWLIPPTDKNLQLYEKWVLSGKQSDVFFGDTVENCIRVHLQEGNTFFIPTGWIHAVYTPNDSLVFGGNFLHQFGIEKQLKIAQVEDTTKVPQKFRYPFFTEMLWYVLNSYVFALLGRTHLASVAKPQDVKPKTEEEKHVHMTPFELHGLKAIVMYLHQLPAAKKNVPDLIEDPIQLVKDVRKVVEMHRHDKHDLAITGIPILKGTKDSESMLPPRTSGGGGRGRPPGSRPPRPPPHPSVSNKAPRRRRTRCKKCEACQRSDCGECVFCQDMVKFGGQGRAKQTCNMRQCLQPMLPVTASCAVCHLDGWMQTPVAPQAKGNTGRVGPSLLMECAVCYGIVHPACVPTGGIVSDDLPNCWECPHCTQLGLHHDYRPRHFRARQKSSEMRRVSSGSVATHGSGGETPTQSNGNSGPRPPGSTTPGMTPQTPQHGNGSENDWEPAAKRARGNSSDEEGPKRFQRAHLANQITSNNRQLKKPVCPVRPAGTPGGLPNPSNLQNGPACLQKEALVHIFKKLPPSDLANASLVCKAWARASVDPQLWNSMSLVQVRISGAALAGVARRQPRALKLEWCTLARKQLVWLLERLPTLKTLSLAGSPADAALALRAGSTRPTLERLDLSFARGLDDSRLRQVLAPPPLRLNNLKALLVSGTDLSDVSCRYIVQWLQSLEELDMSSCARVTDAGAAQLAEAPLKSLSLAGCRLLTEAALDHLARCPDLVRLDLRHVPLVSTQAVIKFAANSKHNLTVHDVKLVEKRET